VKLVTKRRLRNTLIGLGVGAGAGAAIGAAIGPSNGWIIGKGYSALAVGVLGAVSGAVVGVLLPTHETVYQTSPH
jgi:disulfide bond formation protein DsbB